ncbi:MAG: PAS domain S-box protein [Rhodoferax sp.]|uniref:HD domain-containing phosphohydrolase n=1 Tax=Rhodoferax sp. TaxID=50421 RepID=UPI00260BE501|nr:HD domain-containing phosphohydrolase [Rhodoferax sp.]MDD5332852.1 PAS domain S-box protein [Rhodoferax sp.]
MEQAPMNRELRVLMLEDTPTDAELAEHELRKAGMTFTLKRVERRAAFVQALEEFHPDIILSDYKLPDFNGMDALGIVQRDHPDIPMVMVTGALSDIDAVELIHAGAKDYVLKDRLARLAPAVQRVLAAAQVEAARKSAEMALRESEETLRMVAASAQDAILMLDNDGKAVLWNAAAERMFGYSRQEALGRDLHALLSPARFLEAQRTAFSRFKSTGEGAAVGKALELAALRKDGTEFPVELSLSAVKLKERWHAVGIVRDITERKRGELALARANRALRTLSACNVELVRAANEPELLNAVCRLLVDIGGYRMTWVGFPEQDAARTVRAVAHYGHEEGYLATAEISWADTEHGRGPTGTAIRTGSVQVNQDFLANPMMTPWREEASKRGYRSSIALPLKSAADILGVLTIYAAEPDAFNEAEMSLLQELAEDLAFGIQTLRTRLERDRIAHESLQHAEVLRQSLEESIKAIANTVEMRDPYTAGHQRRVGQLAVAIARELGLPEETNHGIELAASIHDLGKISIPAEILSKPSKLTAIEFMLLKNHAQAGFDILKGIQFPWPIATMVLQHHERLDGSGYPQGLRGEQTLLESRILAVADVVEAMASHRPYRAALGSGSALKEIERGRGTVYDAAVVDACQRLFTQKRFAWSA